MSLSNPATWSNLKFTHLSISYNGLESSINKNNQKSKFSYLVLKVELNELITAGLSLSEASYYLAKKNNLRKLILMSNKKNTIRKIHESKFKASIVATGGGANFIADLLSISGASNTILESYVPYSRKSIDFFN